MDTIATRIMQVVDKVASSKSDFARAINVTPAYISKLGKQPESIPSDRTISDICREFNVNEEWLRTGEGEMFRPKTRNEELLEFAVRAAESPSSDIKAKLLHVMAKLTDEQWELLAEIARKWAKEEADQD